MKQHELKLLFCQRNVQKIPAIQCIREHTGYGLKRGKETFDACLAGSEVSIFLPSVKAAYALAADLDKLGVATQVGIKKYGLNTEEVKQPDFHKNQCATLVVKHLETTQERLRLTVELKDGSIERGHLLGAPLNHSVIMTKPILSANIAGKHILVEIEADPEDISGFWEQMSQPGDELLVLTR